jgi:putative ABC transport system permease protein
MPHPLDLAKGAALGLFTSLIAALGPAWEAASTAPDAASRRSSLELRVHRALPWLSAAGAFVFAGGYLLASASTSLVLGFAGLFGIIAGYALLVPVATLGLSRALSAPLGRALGGLGRLAARGIDAGLSRAGLAVAALAVALSATVGVGVMVDSFRGTVAAWLEQTLRADYYIASPASTSSRVHGELDPQTVARVRAVAGVADLSVGRNITLDTPQGPLEVLAVDMAAGGYAGVRLKDGDPATVWPRFDAGAGLLISEPLAYQRKLAPGDRLTLPSETGPVDVPILGVYIDYSSSAGLVLMSRALYQRQWRDSGVSSIGVYLTPGADRARTEAALRDVLGTLEQPAMLSASAQIREGSLEVFDRTFAITHVLRLLVIGVAFVGVVSALLALELERAREHATLRALGLTPRQLLGLTTLQSALLGLIAGLLALPLGLVMADVLIEVINRRAFGWTMQQTLPADVLLEAVVLGAGAAVLAGLYPALRLGRMRPAAALREA